ncbi:ATP-binding protein [Streptomyces sp. NPDC007088]|uniref:ATP-binding protein n=1 Tax=Streptomyces sp. NPDC007088 TaxID=3364773 RepID=UPI0036AD9A6D
MTGPADYRLSVPNDSAAPRLLRDFLAAVLRRAAHDDLVEDARGCLSEIVSNAYRHTGAGQVRLYIAVRRGRVLVAVTDDAPSALPARREGQPYAEHGRGPALVRALAHRTGCRVHSRDGRPYEKTVWFVLEGARSTPEESR